MNSTETKRLLANFFSLGLVQGTNFLVPILIIPYVIGKIGADGFGEVAVAQVFIMFFINVTDYGFNLTATRDVSRSEMEPSTVSKILSVVLITRLLIAALLFSCMLATFWLVPSVREYTALYVLGFTAVVGQGLLLNWLFQGAEQMKFITYVSLFSRVVFALLVLVYIKSPGDGIYYMFFMGLGNILAGVVSVIIAIRLFKLSFIMPSRREVVKELYGGWHIMASNVATSSYMYVNVFFLRLFTNDTVVGYYSVADKVVQAVRQLLSVYFNVIYPKVCQYVQKTRVELYQFFKRFFFPFQVAILLGCIFLLCWPSPVVGYFMKGDTRLPEECLQIMAFVPWLVCLNIPSYQVLLANNEKRSLMFVFISGALFNVVLNIALTGLYGIYGTCFTVLITEVYITAGLVYFYNKKMHTKPGVWIF
ncbi:flippase [Parasegetibacter sp. NRK P23]|nr:flippase [Parasegetibacter sp. NRK P23]